MSLSSEFFKTRFFFRVAGEEMHLATGAMMLKKKLWKWVCNCEVAGLIPRGGIAIEHFSVEYLS